MPIPPHEVSIEDQALAASQGDTEALALLYEQLSRRVLRKIQMRTPSNLELAADIAATAWLKVAQSVRTYEPGRASFESWVMGIALNEWRMHHRLLGRRPEKLTGDMLSFDRTDGACLPEDLVVGKQDAERLAVEVATLVAPQRDCVVYRFVLGYSHAETAALMGKTENAVKQLQHRALETLRKRLGTDVTHVIPAEVPVVPRVPQVAAGAGMFVLPNHGQGGSA